ncbi:MAG: small, acid-soluble spore protein, alpha/beta type [Clostridia bacterium]|nr:small, acid-soluble spore protein, alpha/beta type [Clostridia bacterium]
MPGSYKPLSPQERRKYECARELGLLERLEQVGWAGLTAKESGRIGGKMGRKGRKADQN